MKRKTGLQDDIVDLVLKGTLVVMAIVIAFALTTAIIAPFVHTDDTVESVAVSSTADGAMLTITASSLDGLYDAIDGYRADGYRVVTYPAPYSTKTTAEWFTTMER